MSTAHKEYPHVSIYTKYEYKTDKVIPIYHLNCICVCVCGGGGGGVKSDLQITNTTVILFKGTCIFKLSSKRSNNFGTEKPFFFQLR